ncbi:MAG TPA: archease, partial [Nitrospira sp.]|nr:archease [Nitrospira sp.]
MAHTFRFLEDIAVADMAFEAEGDTEEELFQAATRALLESLANPMTVQESWSRTIEQSHEDLSQLLFDWLSEIIYWKDAAGVVFHDAAVTIAREGPVWRLSARLTGAPVDRLTQELRNDVKGITKHLYEVKQEGTVWKARVVL